MLPLNNSGKETPMASKSLNKTLTMAGAATIAIIFAYFILTAPDKRNGAQKIGDAIAELPEGAEKAARQLEDRTPGEKLQDAAEDAGDDLKKATNQQ
jgi:hypothetical protein